MAAVRSPSLLDDREFLAELAHVEPVEGGDESAHVRERTLDELDEGMPLARPEYPREAAAPRGSSFDRLRTSGSDEWARTSEPAWTGASPSAETELSRDQTAWLVTGFLMLLVLGSVGAVLVFSNRVAEILSLLR